MSIENIINNVEPSICGMNVFKLWSCLKVSHRLRGQIVSYYNSNHKEINQELGAHTAILADLQGPKIRLGDFEKTIRLKKGGEIVFCTKKNVLAETLKQKLKQRFLQEK